MCTAADCQSAVLARGLCSKHYQRAARREKGARPKVRGVCGVSGCDRFVHGQGLCRPHLNRLRKTGVADGAVRPVGLTVPDRFWSHVDHDGPTSRWLPNPSPCWLWTKYRYNGYGRFAVHTGEPVEAHRFAYELSRGAIPAGLVLDHLCRTPACVNPEHLEPVTVVENIRRGNYAVALNALLSGWFG